jgi:hypothetical protein
MPAWASIVKNRPTRSNISNNPKLLVGESFTDSVNDLFIFQNYIKMIICTTEKFLYIMKYSIGRY